jgi:hypothetical protein
MTEEIPVLVCLQGREDTISSVVPGSTQGECDKCAHKVWISVSGRKMMDEEEVKVRCLECTNDEVPDWKPDQEVRVVAGAHEEIAAMIKDMLFPNRPRKRDEFL